MRQFKGNRLRYLKYITCGLLCLLLLAGGALAYFSISDKVTDEDRVYAIKLIGDTVLAKPLTFENELAVIKNVQQSVQKYGKRGYGIPEGQTRNIKDYYELSYGLCYDKSHVIEKTLQLYGFETRHVFIFFTQPGKSKLSTVLQRGSPTHAASEVKTSKGWMFVDSVIDFIGLLNDSVPQTLYNTQQLIHNGTLTHPEIHHVLLDQEYFFVYGLYSRTGMLYPPFNRIPDYKVEELCHNLTPLFPTGL